MKLTTTLNKIRACSPCASGWRTLVKHLGEDFDPNAEINLLTVLESNGVADMLQERLPTGRARGACANFVKGRRQFHVLYLSR